MGSWDLGWWSCPACGVSCKPHRRKCKTRGCRTPRPAADQGVPQDSDGQPDRPLLPLQTKSSPPVPPLFSAPRVARNPERGRQRARSPDRPPVVLRSRSRSRRERRPSRHTPSPRRSRGQPATSASLLPPTSTRAKSADLKPRNPSPPAKAMPKRRPAIQVNPPSQGDSLALVPTQSTAPTSLLEEFQARWSTATHYEVLGVRPSATAFAIRQGHLDFARRHHPDKQDKNNEAYTYAMARASVAYEILGDVYKRCTYDDDMASLRRKAATGRSPTPESPRSKEARIAERVRQRMMGEEEQARASRCPGSPLPHASSGKRSRGDDRHSSHGSPGPQARHRTRKRHSGQQRPSTHGRESDGQRVGKEAAWGLPPGTIYTKRWLCVPGYPDEGLPRLLPKSRRYHKDRGTYLMRIVTIAYDRMRERYSSLPPRST